MAKATEPAGGQKTVEQLLEGAYKSLVDLDLEEACRALEEALKVEYDHPEVLYALLCLGWWQERLKEAEGRGENREKGVFLLSKWAAFYEFLARQEASYDLCLQAVRYFVYATALSFLGDALGDGENQYDPDVLLQVGRCFKVVGDYDRALAYLEQAARFKREDGETLAELADVNALMEETRAAKALFREAFFRDAQGVDLRSMESELILRLAERVRALRYEGEELLEWIPVYGYLWGVFSVKRELRREEVGKLKQAIFALENEWRNQPERGRILVPRLVNRYFWLLDHYENVREDPGLIEETMLKIKLIDPAIYDRMC